mgnify:CR=1 FL=1
MSDLLTIGIILAIYLAISVGIGVYGRSKEVGIEDYFDENRVSIASSSHTLRYYPPLSTTVFHHVYQ